MRHPCAIAVLVLGAVAATLPLSGESQQPVQISGTERLDFPPGGTIHINGSYGYLVVEGWDQPAVEITVTKSLPRPGESKTKDQDRLDGVQVATNRNSATELTISTTLPSRHGDWFPFLPPSKTGGVATEYEIHVPRDTRLAIQNRAGYVFVNGVAGDIEASVSRGDIVLMLPDSGTYSIDAKTKLGAVSSDFDGSVLSRYIVGQEFERTLVPPSQHLYLRMGFGGITIKAVP
ncbi:MAG: DUF4097 domain-containing protein [Acidobacteriia bacterium]|nr:DUF4097 domain-containing protein [Terriglobia bacterium]